MRGIVAATIRIASTYYPPCDIPIIFWTEIAVLSFYFGCLERTCAAFCLCTDAARRRLIIAYAGHSLQILFSCAWCVYGYLLYFSEENNCQENNGTNAFRIIMIILLVVGSFTIINLGLLLYRAPTFLSELKASSSESSVYPRADAAHLSRLFQGLIGMAPTQHRFTYSKLRPTDNTCKICY